MTWQTGYRSDKELRVAFRKQNSSQEVGKSVKRAVERLDSTLILKRSGMLTKSTVDWLDVEL